MKTETKLDNLKLLAEPLDKDKTPPTEKQKKYLQVEAAGVLSRELTHMSHILFESQSILELAEADIEIIKQLEAFKDPLYALMAKVNGLRFELMDDEQEN